LTSKHPPHPAWLIPLLGFSSLLTLAGVTGCARLGGEWLTGARAKGAPAAAAADSVQLTSSALPRLGFATETPGADVLPEGDRPLPMNGLCPPDMASIDDRFCVDKYEASLVEILSNGEEQAWPYYLPVEGHTVRAVSERGVYPQGYISGEQAAEACGRSGKRLCKPREWKTACKGPEDTKFPYGDRRRPGACNDQGKSGMGKLFASEIRQGKGYGWNNMNHPDLNQIEGTLAETGSHEECTNGYGVYDMVGNLHEWVDDRAGAFQGGYYLDVEQLGDGCGYRADAHNRAYHDYSTGFRCCADVGQ
jgi:formylglycine-generating enzyme